MLSQKHNVILSSFLWKYVYKCFVFVLQVLLQSVKKKYQNTIKEKETYAVSRLLFVSPFVIKVSNLTRIKYVYGYWSGAFCWVMVVKYIHVWLSPFYYLLLVTNCCVILNQGLHKTRLGNKNCETKGGVNCGVSITVWLSLIHI